MSTNALTTVDDVARSAIAAIGSSANLAHAIRWTSDRYRQLSNRGKLRALRVVDQLVIPAAITDGTATFTRGSDIVTGNATAQAAWVSAVSTANADNESNPPIVGRYMRYRRVWYKVVALESDGAGGSQIRLANNVAEDTSTAVTYKLVQRHTPIPDYNLRFLGRFVQQRLWRPLTQVSLDELDLMQPERLFVAGTGPEMVCDIGEGDDGRRLVEFYPYALRNEAILFTYYQRSPDLKPGMHLSGELDIEALKMGVLVDLYRFELAQALKENRVEAAEVWRRELRAQEKTWELRIDELLRVDHSVDDASVILHTQGPPTFGDFTFIRTARQDAISRLGNFP